MSILRIISATLPTTSCMQKRQESATHTNVRTVSGSPGEIGQNAHRPAGRKQKREPRQERGDGRCSQRAQKIGVKKLKLKLLSAALRCAQSMAPGLRGVLLWTALLWYFFFFISLALTGALIVLVCYYWSGTTTFSDFKHFCQYP